MSKHDKFAARFGRDVHYAMRHRDALGNTWAAWNRGESAWLRYFRPPRVWPEVYQPPSILIATDDYRPRRALTPDQSEAR